jgi:UPF0755 protein
MMPYPQKQRLARPSASQWAEQLGRFFKRVAIFALNGTTAQVVAVHGIRHNALGVSLSLLERSPLRWAIEAASPVVGAGRSPGGASVAYALGIDAPRAYSVIPLAMPGGIVGLAYADACEQPLSSPQVNAAFGFCQTVLLGTALPTSRRIHAEPRTPRRTRPLAKRDESRVRAVDDETDANERPGSEPIVVANADAAIDCPESEQKPPAGASAIIANADAAIDRPELKQKPPAGASAIVANTDAAIDCPESEQKPPAGASAIVANTDAATSCRLATELDADFEVDTSDDVALDAEASLFTALVQASMAEITQTEASPATANVAVAEPNVYAAAPASADSDKALPFIDEILVIDDDESPSTSSSEARPGPGSQPVVLTQVTTNSIVEAAAVSPTSLHSPSLAIVTPAGVVPVRAKAVHSRSHWRAVASTMAATLAIAASVLMLVAPVSRSHASGQRVVIAPQESLSSIARELETAGLVRSAAGFAWLARLTGAHHALRAGAYTLSSDAWAWEQLRAVTGGQLETVSVTIPEGLTLRETASLLEAHDIAQAADILAAARAPELMRKYDLPGPTAEGWLFPDTYVFAHGISARDVVDAMVRQFFVRIRELPLVSRAELANKVILGSIVERETRDKSELTRVAGVFHNRLERNMRLESCATVQYALGARKDRLTLADVRAPSPYNTYLNNGLPPGAIANPGLDALRAAFFPESHSLLFFFARDDGTHRHIFSRTYNEHLSAQRLIARRD